jgi:hypothetical protein
MVSGASARIALAAFASVHVLLLAFVSRLAARTRARLELAIAVLLPCTALAFVDRNAAAHVEPLGATLLLATCVLHVGLCLDHAQRRRSRLASTATEPSTTLPAPKRRATYRSLLLGVTGTVTLVSLAHAVSLRSDASLASTWGDAATGASILVASVPIVLGTHVALAVVAPRFRRAGPKPGALSRLVLWAVIGATAITLLVVR